MKSWFVPADRRTWVIGISKIVCSSNMDGKGLVLLSFLSQVDAEVRIAAEEL
jgi:hypothetical protein